MERATEVIAEWRQQALDEAFFSASRVQDRLFELYTELQHHDVGSLIETWLTLTIQRDLFSGDEILGLLEEIHSRLADPVSAG